MIQALYAVYRRVVLNHPWLWMLLIVAMSVFSLYHARDFRLDASADSLILENDEALAFYREVAQRYGGSEFLIVTYEPSERALFSRPVLDDLATLQQELAVLPRVESVYSMLDVPLLYSPKEPLGELAKGYRTLRDADAPLELAAQELSGRNPLYRDLLVNRDGSMTALLITFERDDRFYTLLQRRDDLRERVEQGQASSAEKRELRDAERAYSDYSAGQQERNAAEIAHIRSIMDGHRDRASLFLGGAAMIASDAVSYVRNDLEFFSLGVGAFLILALLLIFRRARWVVLPLSCCALTVLWTLGWLGFADWKVTVISSNFVSLLLIITMSMAIHLTVRYRELQLEHPAATQRELVQATLGFMARPIIYTALTTIVAFISLVVSGIRPVIDFGWIMTFGLCFALFLCLVFYPSLLALLPKDQPREMRDVTRRATLAVADFNASHHLAVVLVAVLLGVGAVWGTTKLTVENRFIDYFKEHTEIYQGMVAIDRHLGGTTPLDIVIDAPRSHTDRTPPLAEDDPFADPFSSAGNNAFAQHDDEFGDDPFGDPFADPFDAADEDNSADALENAYWYTPQRLDQLLAIQHYLESLPETGKVLSLASVYEVATDLNNAPLSYFDLMMLARFVPETLRTQLVKPYLSEDGNQVRISIRVVDSDRNLNRNDLLAKIHHDLTHDFDLEPEQVTLTGAMVLYNNMLQSLFQSQIATLGFVFLSIMAMFLVLFRSLALSVIAMLPNLLSAAFILGLMGWIGLPLDIMTITIAAITIGIAVDASIHYIHRFRVEFPRDHDYVATMKRCHGSIGTAVYYTSMIIVAGFLILVASNFKPTVYFGALTSLAMVVALTANLTVMPSMLVWLKPRIPPLK